MAALRPAIGTLGGFMTRWNRRAVEESIGKLILGTQVAGKQ